MTQTLFTALACACACACLAAASRMVKQSDACTSLSDHSTREQIKACVESYTVPKQKVLDMIKLVNATVQLYPYTTILKDKASIGHYYDEPVLLEAQLAELHSKAAGETGEDLVLIDYYADLIKIVNSARDGHFRVIANSTDEELNLLNELLFFIPFNIRINSTSAQIDRTVLTPEDVITTLKENGATIQTIDGKKPDVWVAELMPMCNSMKSQQGRYTANYYTTHSSAVTFSMCPDVDAIFKDYTVVLENGASFTFNFLVAYVPLRQTRGLDVKPYTFGLPQVPDEKAALEALKKYANAQKTKVPEEKTHAVRQEQLPNATTSDGTLMCMVLPTANFLAVYSFSPEDVNEFVGVLMECSKLFNNNTNIIIVDVRMNGGGSVVLEEAVFMALFPQSDSRMLAAIKPTAYDAQFFTSVMAYKFDTCEEITSPIDEHDEWYSNTINYTYGEETDVRTQAFYFAAPFIKDIINSDPIFTKNPRSQHQVYILTDGYCFSACSMLVNQARETHSAITVGVNKYPSGTSFEDSQCATTVIQPGLLSEDFANMCEAAGLSLTMSYIQTFTIDDHGNTGVPHDFQHHEVDWLLENVTVDFDLPPQNQMAYLMNIATALSQRSAGSKCITGTYKRTNCDVSEHGYGAMECKEGQWDNTTCVLRHCDLYYVLKATANQCLLDVCNPEEGSSSSASSSEESSTQTSSSGQQQSSSSSHVAQGSSSSSAASTPYSSTTSSDESSYNSGPSGASTLSALGAAAVAVVAALALVKH